MAWDWGSWGPLLLYNLIGLGLGYTHNRSRYLQRPRVYYLLCAVYVIGALFVLTWAVLNSCRTLGLECKDNPAHVAHGKASQLAAWIQQAIADVLAQHPAHPFVFELVQSCVQEALAV